MLLSVPSISSANGSSWNFVESNVDFKLLNLPANFTFAENNAIQLKDGRVMVIGTKNSYIYNYKTQRWSVAMPVNQKGDIYSPVLLQDGRVMVFVETDVSNDSKIVKAEIYDPATNRWTATSELNTPRFISINAVLMQDGRVMIAGGWYGEGNDVEIYNPYTNTWSKAADMKHKANSGVTFLPLKDGRILATGGSVLIEGDGTQVNSKYAAAIEIYNPKTNQWDVHSINQNFNGATKLMHLSNGSILFLGNYKTGIYYLQEDKFKSLTESGFHATDALELKDGRILMTGSDSKMKKGKAYLYSQNTWELIEIAIPSTRPLLYSLPNDQILALGTNKQVSELGYEWIWDWMYTYSPSGIFLDVPNGYWAEDEIKYLVDLGIISGMGNGRFDPSSAVTRAQGASMIARSLNLDLNNRPNPGFNDLSTSHWAYKAVAALVDEGVFSKGTDFQPDKPLTREEIARLLVDAYQLEGVSDNKFTDISKDYWASSYINILATNEIAAGYPDGSFKPKKVVTRTEFSAFIARVMDESFR